MEKFAHKFAALRGGVLELLSQSLEFCRTDRFPGGLSQGPGSLWNWYLDRKVGVFSVKHRDRRGWAKRCLRFSGGLGVGVAHKH